MIRGYSVGAYYSSLFGNASVYGKGGVVPRTTHLPSQNVNFCIDGDVFLI